jgi:glycine dehydrogenase subunit 1
MDVANASMYDGATAAAEAAQMAARVTGRKGFLVARTLHPEYRQVISTVAHAAGQTVTEFAYDARSGRLDVAALAAAITPATACVMVQTPNFFGVVEELKAAADIAHGAGALLVVVFTEPVAFGLVAPPKEADIVAGELQSFAIPPSYGGPGAGVIATREKYIRQIPGRLVGETVDADGNRAYCLTLATREQHIRREKATSNICSNQALVALTATVFLAVYGKQGLRELAEQNLAKAHYLASGLDAAFSGPFFNEFVARPRGKTAAQANAALLEKKIIGGLELGRFYPELEGAILLCATEMAKRAEMDTVKEVLG